MMKNSNFTPRVRKVINTAKKTAIALNSDSICLNHLLFGLLESDQSTIKNFFTEINISIEDLKLLVFNKTDSDFINREGSLEHKKYSKDFSKVLKLSISFSEELDHEYIGIEHIFYVLLVYEHSPLKDFLSEFYIDIEDCKDKFRNFFLNGDWEKSKVNKTFKSKKPPPVNPPTESSLQSYAKNYNQLAVEGKFDKVICKEEEIEKI